MPKKVTFYLDYPNHFCYDVTIQNIHEPLSNIIPSIFHKLYPLHLHTYSTATPSFIRIIGDDDKNTHYDALDPGKSYVENNILSNAPAKMSDSNPEIRIRLKIHTIGHA